MPWPTRCSNCEVSAPKRSPGSGNAASSRRRPNAATAAHARPSEISFRSVRILESGRGNHSLETHQSTNLARRGQSRVVGCAHQPNNTKKQWQPNTKQPPAGSASPLGITSGAGRNCFWVIQNQAKEASSISDDSATASGSKSECVVCTGADARKSPINPGDSSESSSA
jgi:hypothetical protein